VQQLIGQQKPRACTGQLYAAHQSLTSDHVSRCRRAIVHRLEERLMDETWLDHAASDLAVQRRFTPAQAAGEIGCCWRGWPNAASWPTIVC